jgi:hypothetical protein
VEAFDFEQSTRLALSEQACAMGFLKRICVSSSGSSSDDMPMAPYPQCPLRNHDRATDMPMAFHRRKDRDWLDYATLTFFAALSVGLRFGGPSRFPFRGVLTQLPKPN